ncbi:MAG: dethiobiotin synthase [Candidatus Omnitrophica bacterium]|nr:dethiobiotin synthase [Candidatus Omnitrophota bacterium]
MKLRAKAIFIAGTDTGVGKTIITGCLAKYLSEKGYRVITQKWIQTGCRSVLSSDIKLHLKLMRRDTGSIKELLHFILPYIFKTPCSPHLASRIENKKIHENKIIKSFKALSAKLDFVIVEGTGGALVPFNRNRLVIDIVKELDLAVLIVAENKLGAINHTLLTIEALTQRKIRILGLVFNNVKEKNKYILKDNPQIIKTLTKQKVFGILPSCDSYQLLYENFIPIGKKILREL